VSDLFDCAVVGAGPAGLTAAVYLGRFLRRVVVLHDEQARAAWIPRSHNLPGWPEGVGGPELLARLHEQAVQYGAEIRAGRAEHLRRADDGVFELHDEAGLVRARKVLLATGVKDNEPDLPDLFQAVRRGLIRICPICDGYEVRGQAVGVIGNGAKGAREALFLRTYTDRLTLVHVGAPTNLDAEWRRRLAQAGVEVVETPIQRVEIENDRVAAFAWDGVTRRLDTIYSALGTTPRARLAREAGAATAEDGRLVVTDHQETSVPGLYAAGDLVKGLNQIATAMAEAAIAATDVHNCLREEDGQAVTAAS
jgi:thioredoxin reductase (NADPH)